MAETVESKEGGMAKDEQVQMGAMHVECGGWASFSGGCSRLSASFVSMWHAWWDDWRGRNAVEGTAAKAPIDYVGA